MKRLDKKGISGSFVTALIFGITALIVSIIIALVIISSLNDSSLLTSTRPLTAITNESFSGIAQGVWVNHTGYTLAGASASNLVSGSFVITKAWNQTAKTEFLIGNISVTAGGVIKNTSATNYPNATVSYTYLTESPEEITSGLMSANFTSGIDNVSAKIPTVLLVGAIVLILSILALLVGVWQKMRMGGGSI